LPESVPWVIAPDTHEGVQARTSEVWRYRRILWFFALKAVQVLYAKTHLGPAWILIRTLVPLAVSSFVYGSVMNVPSGGIPYFLFFLIGQIPWNCFDGPVIRGSRGLEMNRILLTKLYIPRMILPLAQMGAGLIEPVILVVVLLGSLIYYRTYDGIWYLTPSIQMLAAAASVFTILAFAFSLTLWTSVWQARARDTKYVVRHVVSFWMFFTPVIYPLSVVPSHLRWVMHLNPLTEPIETFRWALIPTFDHSWAWFGYSVAVTLLTLVSGIWYFARSESITVDRI
jgi:lipopolysaccharide transport system permease protein